MGDYSTGGLVTIADLGEAIEHMNLKPGSEAKENAKAVLSAAIQYAATRNSLWSPIATAPKDRPFIGRNGTFRPFSAKWDKWENVFVADDGSAPAIEHWMIPPVAPELKEATASRAAAPESKEAGG